MAFNADSQELAIGVIGTGTMGRGIIQVAATGGLRVQAFDAQSGAAGEAKKFVASMLQRAVDKQKLSAAAMQQALERIEIVENLEAMAGNQLIIEVIVEQLPAKRELFMKLDALTPPDTILASNTSSLSITEIASACQHPERVAGFHFFNPVPLMKLVEVIAGIKTQPWVIDALMKIGRRMGREPVLTQDTPGFLVNHIGRAYVPEALRILSEGIARPEAIDRIMREAAGYRMGPLELIDLVGVDVAHPVMESIYNQYYQEPMYQPSVLTRTRLAGRVLGQKTGQGFYVYEERRAIVPPEPAGMTARPARVWVSRDDPQGREAVLAVLDKLNRTIDTGETPAADALCIVTPLGEDATTAAVRQGLDATRTVAIDTLFGLDRRRTIMITPVTSHTMTEAAQGLFQEDGVPVTVIHDSPGFVAQRIAAMIINVGCNIAQQQIATPEDIDRGARLGLNYPMGPLELGNHIGPARVLRILEGLQNFYGEPRYRPSPWLKRRAMLGVSLLTAEGQ